MLRSLIGQGPRAGRAALASLIPATLDLLRQLVAHVRELRAALLAGEEASAGLLAELDGLGREAAVEELEELVRGTDRSLRALARLARKVRTAEQTHLGEIIRLTGETLGELASSDERLSSSALAQLAQADGALDARGEGPPRVAIGAVVNQLRQALDRHAEERRSQSRRLGALAESLKAEVREARERSARDALTRLSNRGAFDEELSRSLTAVTAGLARYGLIMIDVDHFKQVNDGFGHPAGDDVLRQVADRLVRVCLRRDDFVARYGGEEFAVILKDVDEEGLLATAERLRRTIAEAAIDARGTALAITVSCGVGLLTEEDDGASALARVDAALYESKAAGRNRVTLARRPAPPADSGPG